MNATPNDPERQGHDDYFVVLPPRPVNPPPPPLPAPTADRDAGAGAREMQAREASRRREVDRFLDGLLNRHSRERAWRKGAEGEEWVAGLLARRLPDGWYVLHDITIGRKGANLDHLAIGPGGVFSINTKNLTGNVTVYDGALLHNGRSTSYLGASRREAEDVADRLSIASGWTVSVQPVIAVVGARIRVKKRPEGVMVVDEYDLVDELKAARPTIAPEAVVKLSRLARSPRTWAVTAQGSSTSTPATRGPNPDLRPPDPRKVNTRLLPPPLDPLAGADWTVKRWRRSTHDRLYVNRGDGTGAGWLDVRTGKFHDVRPDEESTVRQVLARHVRRAFD